MPISTSVVGSPGWWLDRLIKRLGDRQTHYNRGEAYYLGDPPLPHGAHQARQAYQRLLRIARMNMGELVVEATRERMMVTGFRTTADGRAVDDGEAWRIWQANSLDADQALIDIPSLSMGDAYAIVGLPDPDIGAPVITAEDPRQVITEHDPIRHRKIRAALKCYTDSADGIDKAHVYLPASTPGTGARVWHAIRNRASADDNTFLFTADEWEWRTETRLPIDDVPVVRFANRALNWTLPGRSELDGAFDTLDRINHMVLERVVIATVQAYRQRAVKGNLPVTDGDGNEIDYSAIFAPDPGAMWQLPEGVDIWESQQIDLTPILTAVRHDIQDLAAATRTPLFYLTPDAANGSAEGASLAREGLIHKVLDRIAQAGESWERVIAIALAMNRDPRGAAVDMEVVWQPPERFSLAEKADAAVKLAQAGVPWETVMLDVMQYSPQQVERMRAQRATEAFLTPDAAPA